MNIKEVIDMLWSNSLEDNVNIIKKKINLIKPLAQFDSDHPCIFVLSTGRAGTKTLSALLNSSPEYTVYHEPKPKLYRLGKAYYEQKKSSVEEQLFQEAFSLARSLLFESSLKIGCGYIETSPQVTFLAKIVHDLMPSSKFIHLVRDPREVVRSGMRRNWFNNPEYDQNRITPIRDSVCQIDWENSTEFEKNVWLWAETNAWIMNFISNIKSERVIRIFSNDLFNAKDDAINNLFDFIKREKPSSKHIDNVIMKKLNSQQKGEFPVSEKWSTDMNQKLQKIAGGTIKALGFNIN